MSILGFLLLIVVLGVLLWLVNTYVPMDPKIKQILNIVVVIFIIIVAIWFLLGLFGVSVGDLGLNRPAGRPR